MNNKTTVGILGYGEIGSSIGRIVEEKHEVTAQDPRLGKKFDKKFDVMHVCVPFIDKFMDIVAGAIKEHKPKLTIIESTVQVGTTRKIAEATKASVVHSPCRGVHPNLTEGIKTFVKFVGATNKEDAKAAAEHYASLGIKAEVCDSPEDTELGKIMSTTYYMANIVFCKEVARLCKEKGLNFDHVYTKFNNTYNEGYVKLGMPHVVRPVLKAMPGKVGGHCLRPNVELLNKYAEDKLFRLLQELDDSYADEK